MANRSLLVLSWNGCSRRLLESLMQRGRLPVVKRLAHEGSSGALFSVLPTFDYPAWASFHTGVSPGKHGVFAFQEICDHGLPSPRLVTWESVRYKTLLEILSEQGKQIVSLYLPLTYPPKPLSGCIVSEVLMRDALDFTYPPELGREMTDKFGDLMIPKPEQFFPADGIQDPQDIQEFLAKQIQSIIKTEELALYLMRKFPWEVAFIQFYATDTVQHALWHYLDPDHPGFVYDTKVEHEVAEFFNVLDRSIGKLVQHAEPSAVLVFSDHGFGPCNKVLNLEKFMQTFVHMRSPLRGRVRQHSLQLVRRIDFLNIRRKVLGHVLQKSMRHRRPGIYFDHKVVFVDIKEKGESYVDELIQGLETLADPETGGCVIKRVWRVEDLYGNYYPSRDVAVLILELAAGYSCRSGSVHAPLLIPCIPNKNYLSGTHTRESFWIWFGTGIAKHDAFSIDILDLPPTILTYMGIDIPSWMEGKVIPIFQEENRSSEKVVVLG